MSVKKLLNRLRESVEFSKRIVLRYSDPGKGIEYNKISTRYKLSKYLWNVDAARSPQMFKHPDKDSGIFVNIDVHAAAHKANSMRPMVDYRATMIKGRSHVR